MGSITVTSHEQLKSPGYWLFIQQLVLGSIKEKIKVPCYWLFVRGIHRSPLDSPHKGPVTWKPFSCDDIIMMVHLHSAHNTVKPSVTVHPIKYALFGLHCWLSQSQSSKLNNMGKIRQCLTIAKHQLYKAQIFVKIPCSKLQINV